MEGLDVASVVKKYLEMAWRRRFWVIIPFLVVILAGLLYALKTPPLYEAKTLILVEPQKVPQEFVKSIVPIGVEERLRTISQQLTSRTNLEAVIKEYKLYVESDALLETKVELVRKRININVVRGGGGSDAFEVAFRDKDPIIARDVANALTSNFIGENLKIRESRAIGTSDFLRDELESVRKKLESKEEQLKEYREKHIGGMPENLQTNLTVLTRLQAQQEQLSASLRDAENRKLIIQQQMADAERMNQQMGGLGSGLIELDLPTESSGPSSPELAGLKKELALLQGRYTENHPDVRRLKEMIANLESQASSVPEETAPAKDTPKEETANPLESQFTAFSAADFLKPQLEQVNAEIKSLKDQVAKVTAKMDLHQKRVDDSPEREQELMSLTRDYDNLKRLYESMLNRKLEAEIAVSMERKQKGEQFRVIDPAKIPEKPVEPDMIKILLLTLVLGLGLGGGLAYVVEVMDTSYKNPQELEKDVDLPVLVSVPIRLTTRELKMARIRQVVAYGSICAGFVFSAVAIVVGVKGVDKAIELVKGLVEKV